MPRLVWPSVILIASAALVVGICWSIAHKPTGQPLDVNRPELKFRAAADAEHALEQAADQLQLDSVASVPLAAGEVSLDTLRQNRQWQPQDLIWLQRMSHAKVVGPSPLNPYTGQVMQAIPFSAKADYAGNYTTVHIRVTDQHGKSHDSNHVIMFAPAKVGNPKGVHPTHGNYGPMTDPWPQKVIAVGMTPEEVLEYFVVLMPAG